MALDNIKEQLKNSLYYNLITNCPILSGNMSIHISMGYGNDGYEIIIEAPFYDNKKFRKEGIIVHTGEVNKYGDTDYAFGVNEYGAFGKHNKSEHWVNRTINDVCNIIASEYHGVIEGELER